MIGFKENIPDEWMEKIKSYDTWINGHIDGLDIMDEKFPWAKYFNKFPKPEINPVNNIGDFCVSHLISSTNGDHRLNTSFYLPRLIKEIDKFCKERNWQHIIISQESINSFYESTVKECVNSRIFNGSITDVCDVIVNAKLMISVDSGFRPIAYPLMPVVSLSKQCSSPNIIPISHQLRWNPIKPYFPLNYDTGTIIKTARKLLDNQVYSLFPELCLTDQDLSSILIKREYKVNEEKSVLA